MSTVPDEQVIALLSPDKDFADALAEQVREELPRTCVIFSSKNEFNQYIATKKKPPLALITTESSEEHWPCPVISVNNPPLKLQDILDDAARLLQNQSMEDAALGGGYSVQWRQKQLSHAGKSVSLTDKEAQLLQSLADAEGEVVTKEYLLKTVWGFGDALDTHTLETHIYRLRGKFRELAGDESMIAAIEGGYKLEL